MTAPHPHKGGHCDCDEHERHTDTCADDECDGCVEGYDPGCDYCNGTGVLTWDWDAYDDAVCDRCGVEAKCAGWGEDGETPYCLDCARKAHARLCGCDAPGWTS